MSGLPRSIGALVLRLLNELESEQTGRIDTDEAFISAFEQRFWPYLLILLIPLFAMSTDPYTTHWSIPTQAYGLILDLAGGVIIVRGLFRGETGIERETQGTGVTLTPRRTEDEPVYIHVDLGSIAAAKKTIDGLWGACLLTTGFGIQLYAVASPDFSQVIALCFGIVVAFALVRLVF